MNLLEFYAVRKKGTDLYFRPRGQGGYGAHWVEITKAKIYPRIGTARTQVTFWANFGVDVELVKLGVTIIEAIDETERLRKTKETKEHKEAAREERRQKERLRNAQSEYDKAKHKLNLLKGEK